VAGAQAAHSVAYIVPGFELLRWLTYFHAAWLANACDALCWVLILMALMGIRVGRGRWVRVLDGVLTSLCCTLLMLAMGSGPLPGHGLSRVIVTMLAITLVTAAAWAAQLASTRPGVRQFSSVIAKYMTACLIVCFLLDIVNLYWLPQPNILASDLLLAFPQVLLCEWVFGRNRVLQSESAGRYDAAMLDSLQPSLTAVGGVLLALYGLRSHSFACGVVVTMIVLCYAVRTQIFYHRLFEQQKRLHTKALRMEQLATRDSLTGVGNRRWFEQAARTMLQNERMSSFAVLLVDADNFKEINDTFGHFVGDEMLRHVASALVEQTSNLQQACTARLGGDEFAVLLSGMSLQQALGVANAVGAQVRSARELAVLAGPSLMNTMFRPTVSIGVAWIEDRQLSLGMLMRWADAALYRAKDCGRDCVRSIDLTAMADAEDLSVLEALPKIGREPPAPVFPEAD
jgi:diguanylate cyclase (GGDEF)-like protein